jgi:hypothetical protein
MVPGRPKINVAPCFRLFSQKTSECIVLRQDSYQLGHRIVPPIRTLAGFGFAASARSGTSADFPRFRNAPTPFPAFSAPSSTTARPRTGAVTGQPVTSISSYRPSPLLPCGSAWWIARVTVGPVSLPDGEGASEGNRLDHEFPGADRRAAERGPDRRKRHRRSFSEMKAHRPAIAGPQAIAFAGHA